MRTAGRGSKHTLHSGSWRARLVHFNPPYKTIQTCWFQSNVCFSLIHLSTQTIIPNNIHTSGLKKGAKAVGLRRRVGEEQPQSTKYIKKMEGRSSPWLYFRIYQLHQDLNASQKLSQELAAEWRCPRGPQGAVQKVILFQKEWKFPQKIRKG